jgi:hypothetical protein
MFDLEDFQPISLKDKPVFKNHYSKFPPNHSENTYTTLVSWNHYVQSYYLTVKDNLIIMTKPDGQVRLRPPSGNRDPEVLKRVVQIAEESGTTYLLVLIDNQEKEWISKQYPEMIFTLHRDYFDYVYLASDLAELKGKKYLKIRNKLNKFNKLYEYEIEPMCGSNIAEIKDFLQRWCLWKDCESDPILDNERIAILDTIKHCFDYELEGIAIRIDDEIEAVSVYESISTEMAVIHFEKAMPDFEGLYQVINKEAAKILATNHRYINRQSDLGIDGLRTAKMRYHPHHMIEVQHMARDTIEDLDKQDEVY